MKLHLFTFLLLSVPTFLFAQVGIGTTNPNTSAKLDVTSVDKGFLPPRVSLTATNAAGPISSPATGLLVYNTATAGTSPNNVVPGYYYNGGTPAAPVWKRLATVEVDNTFKLASTGTASRYSSQTLTSNGVWYTINNSQLQVIVPAGYTDNRVILQWNVWGDMNGTTDAGGSLRFQIKQTSPTSNTFQSVMMTGWTLVKPQIYTTWSAPVTYILENASSGTYIFDLEVLRESEAGTITNVRSWGVSGTTQVYVK